MSDPFKLFGTAENPALPALQVRSKVRRAILGLCVSTDFLFVPVALSLSVRWNRSTETQCSWQPHFVGLFVVLNMAVTWTNYASLLTLSGLHAAAANDMFVGYRLFRLGSEGIPIEEL